MPLKFAERNGLNANDLILIKLKGQYSPGEEIGHGCLLHAIRRGLRRCRGEEPIAVNAPRRFLGPGQVKPAQCYVMRIELDQRYFVGRSAERMFASVRTRHFPRHPQVKEYDYSTETRTQRARA